MNWTSLEKRGPSFLALLGIAFAIGKLIAAAYYISPNDSIFGISFGFGPYVRSLYETGRFSSCEEGVCNHASRMPLLPATFAVIAGITQSLLVGALIKNLLLSVFTIFSFSHLLKFHRTISCRVAAVWSVFCVALAFSPPVIKHASAVHYEEGFLMEILFLWAYAVALIGSVLFREDLRRRVRPIVVSSLLLGTAAFFTKSSMILVLLVSIALAVFWSLRNRDRRVLVAAAVCIAAVLAWGERNKAVTGRFSVMTSWDGSNVFRGFSEAGYRLYPDVVLDRLLDSDVAYKEDGEAVLIDKRPCVVDEWVCDDYFRSLARRWLMAHPREALQFTLRKAQNLFVGIRKTPYTYGNDARSLTNRRSLDELVTSAWLFGGRLLEIAMLGLVIRLWRERDVHARALVVTVLVANTAYAIPYVVGFSYERHVSAYLVLVAVSVSVMVCDLVTRTSKQRDSRLLGLDDGVSTVGSTPRSIPIV